MHHEFSAKVQHPYKTAFFLASVYVLLGVIFIAFSHTIIDKTGLPLDQTTQIHVFQGFFSLLISGICLYILLVVYLKRFKRLIEEKLLTTAALKTAVERFPGPSAIIDADRKVSFMNRSAVELQSLHPGKIQPNQVIPGLESESYWLLLNEVFETRQTKGGEVQFGLGVYSTYYVATLIPLLKPNGEVDCVLALTYDITDRKHSAIKTDKQKRELRQIIDLIPNLIFAKDDQGQYILANEAFSRFHGLSTEEILGETTLSILSHNMTSAEILSDDEEVLEHGREIFLPKVATFDTEGNRHYFQVTKIPFRTTSENRGAVLGIGIDITERLQTEQAINKSEERFRALVDHSLDALFVYDSHGTLNLVNERACEMLGLPSEELIGQGFEKILMNEDVPSVASPPIFQVGSCFQMVLHGSTRHAVPVEIRVGPLPGDEAGAFLAEARDITERIQIEQERQALSRLGIKLSAARNPSEVADSLFNMIRGHLPMDSFFFAHRISGKARFRKCLVVDSVNGELKYFPGDDYTVRLNSPIRKVYGGKNLLLLRPMDCPIDRNFSNFGNTQRQSKSVIYCPVMLGDKVIAIVSVQSYQLNAYTQDDLDVVQRMADMAAPALESSLATFKASIFSELGRQLGAARTAEDVAEIVAILADKLAGWDACSIALYSHVDDSITYIYLADEVDGQRMRLEEPRDLERPRYLAERVLKEGPFLILKDKNASGEISLIPSKTTRTPLSMIWVPIPGEEGPVGFIALHRYAADTYDETDLESIRALADHCGAAINRTASQELLRYTEQRYRLAIESTGAVAYQIDYATSNYVFMGEGIEAITGYPPESFTAGLWKRITLELHQDPNCEVTYDDEGRRYFKQWMTEARIRRFDGEERWISDQAVQLHNAAGTPTGTLGILRDITEQKHVELALRASEERYALSARGANDGLWDWDLKTDQIHFSERWAQMLGHPPNSIFHTADDWFKQIHPDDLESMKSLLQEHLLGTAKHFECEVRTCHSSGIYLWMLVRGIAVRDAEGTPTRIAGSQTDITDRVITQERLMHEALHDPLTGLPNRSLLMEHLERCLDHLRRRTDYKFAVVFMDLDRFKNINDSLGHLTGDHVLVAVSKRLKQAVRPMDIVARFAGDEFAVVLDQINDESEIVEIVSRIQTIVSEPIMLDNHEISTSASVGVALGSLHYRNPSEILRDADNALYRSKADGVGHFRIFDKSMHDNAVRLLRLEADLRRAMERDQLKITFQPIISIDSGKVQRFEALLRWEHPEMGLMLPDQFMSVAEETGLVFELDEWMMRESCRHMKRWLNLTLDESGETFDNLKINVNLSPRHFLRHINIAKQLTDIVLSEGLTPDMFGLELTENALISFHDETTEALRDMKKAGFALYLDDFGKGYSSLSYLHNFPFDVVKIDRMFIMKMQNDSTEREVVEAILTLASKLNLGVVAEGVESAEQMDIVRQLGCNCAQGFYISRPIGSDEVVDLVLQARVW